MAKKSRSIAASAAEGQILENNAGRILEDYLTDLKAIRSSGAGVPETSYYPALSNLFNSVGKTLRPKVRCIIHTKNQGSGIPDGGLFTIDQFQRQADDAPKAGQLPARGAIEAKGTKDDVHKVAESKQVKDYLGVYGIVIVTNLRNFLIVERGASGQPVEREAFSLAADEKDFWQNAAAHPRSTTQRVGKQFVEFVMRACLHAAPLSNPKDLAWFLASYARDALARVEVQKELPALNTVREALEDALGMKFTEERGEHFFRSTLVQTLFYGVFSSWVSWHKSGPAEGEWFDWKKAEWSLHVPFIRALFEEVARPSRLKPLGLEEVLDWASGVLNRVNRGEFFERFQEEHAVQYFYEPFLEAYDPDLRRELGVWYTPPEIVKYQVARVDRVLRDELELPDGLADPNVVVLDPCCGTGAYLVEVLHTIARTLRDKGGDALVASDLKEAAKNRVFGFEILPAPFVVSHLQLGMMLQKEGAPLSQKTGERVGVYLTNALTGWEPPKGPKQHFMYPELEEERDAAEQVKRQKKILVILGNPPYNAFSGISPAEEQGLVEPYKKDLNKPVSAGGWGIKKFNLDDLYVRFFRLAERRIAEMSGMGVISFISNFSYLSDPSFVVMRQRLLAEFDKLWFDCMNGDSRETGKLTPAGNPDPSVFSTGYNREGIRVGTAVCVIVRKIKRLKKPIVRFRQFWGATKREDLLKTFKAKKFDSTYTRTNPIDENRYTLRPEEVTADYSKWPKIVEFCALNPSNGLMEKRGGALIDVEQDKLVDRMQDYFDPEVSWEEYKARHSELTENAARFIAKDAREKAIKTEKFSINRIMPYALRPFDSRWCYYTPVRPIWNEPRPSLWAQFWKNNQFLIARFRSSTDKEGHPLSFTVELLDDHYLMPDAVAIPLRLLNGERLSDKDHATLFDVLGDDPSERKPTANLAKSARDYLDKIGIKNPDKDANSAGLIWMHSLAIGYSPAYLTENADGIRRDWPRIPLPNDRKALEQSAEIGERIAAYLDTETEVSSITNGKILPAIKTVAVISKHGGGSLDPSSDDLLVTAGWGHKGKDGVTMPAKGKIVRRAFSAEESRAIAAEAAARGMEAGEVERLLGGETCDVFLNDTAYWRNVPVAVWEYYIGGYQVIKKWLSYREDDILGRPLKPEEAREVMNMARRIAAIVLMQPELDRNYQAVTASTYDWNMGS